MWRLAGRKTVVSYPTTRTTIVSYPTAIAYRVFSYVMFEIAWRYRHSVEPRMIDACLCLAFQLLDLYNTVF